MRKSSIVVVETKHNRCTNLTFGVRRYNEVHSEWSEMESNIEIYGELVSEEAENQY